VSIWSVIIINIAFLIDTGKSLLKYKDAEIGAERKALTFFD